jgi:Domain of unknown function (DUF222)/HNH endonuclease
MAAFRAGRITEWKATLVARETACLSLEHRRLVDRELAGNPGRIEAMGDGELVAEARRLACHLEPAAVAERRRRAEAQRRVTLRPAPDVMSHLSVLLPVKAGVAVYAVLCRAADQLRSAGDPRTRGQLMVDALVDLVTRPGASSHGGPDVTVHVVVPDTVLRGESDEGAFVDGFGDIPGDLARDLAYPDAERGTDTPGRRWWRRVYAQPATGALVAMDAKARLAPAGLGRFVRLRDRSCRTPWCDAPIRHTDHVVPAAAGGPTSLTNLQGLCEACNHAKQAPDWRAEQAFGIRHTVSTTTPTGHTYASTAPSTGRPGFREVGPGRWSRVA